MSSSVSMIMTVMTEILVRIGVPPNFRDIELSFTFSPTKNDVVEAARQFLTDQEVEDGLALHFMEIVKTLPLPKSFTCSEDMVRGKKATIWNLPRTFFHKENQQLF